MTVWHELKQEKMNLVWELFKQEPLPSSLRPYALFFVCVSLFMLSSAFLFQYVGGYPPCAFCLYERWLYGVAGVFALWMLFTKRVCLQRGLLFLILLSFFANVGVSAYHVAIEHKWVPAPSLCHSKIDTQNMSFEAFKKKLLATKFVPCDQVPLRILGLSLVEYNLIITFGISVLSLFLFRKRWREKGCASIRKSK